MTGNLSNRITIHLGNYINANSDNWKGICLKPLALMYRYYQKKGGSVEKFKSLLHRNSPAEVIWRRAFQKTDECLTQGVFYCYGAMIDGDIAEFGTQTGRTARVISKATHVLKGVAAMPPKSLYLFDSFEGLPLIESPVDRSSPYVVSRVWNPGSLKGLSEKELINVCVKWLPRDRIIVHSGWFCDTLPRLHDDTKFAMLHIDCDLYQSALDVLDICFSRGFIAEGAIILFDDWNTNKASYEFGERRAWREIVEKYSVEHSDGGGYSWHAHKFIVHSYKRD